MDEEEKEPDVKRRREDVPTHEDHAAEAKVRKLRRTTRPDLLFAFTYFDLGHAGYIRDHDLCELLHLLGLRYSKSQVCLSYYKIFLFRCESLFPKLPAAGIMLSITI